MILWFYYDMIIRIVRIKFGGRLFIIISDYGLIKTAMNKPELSGRPDFFTIRLFMFFKNVGKHAYTFPHDYWL